jgi:hypothetical protein
LVAAAFVLEAATSYFAPAYGALVPSLVDRRNVQQANALVQASAQAVSIGGWTLAAALLAVLPISTFFAVNAASFFVSALPIGRVRRRPACPTLVRITCTAARAPSLSQPDARPPALRGAGA